MTTTPTPTADPLPLTVALELARRAGQRGDGGLWAHALIAAYGLRSNPSYPEALAICRAAIAEGL